MPNRPPDHRLSIRIATFADLEDITTTAQLAFPDDPEFDYRFPDRDKYPEDHREYLRQEYREYLEQSAKYDVVVVTASDNHDKVIALSVWNKAVRTPHVGTDLGVPSGSAEKPRRRDVNAAHFREFARRMDEAFDEYFASYGDSQLHLWLLATRPAFRRRGAGTGLCKWGLKTAAAMGVPTTVLGSPMGKKLYEEIGFTLKGNFIIRVEGEAEHLKIWALTHEDDAFPVNKQSLQVLEEGRCWRVCCIM